MKEEQYRMWDIIVKGLIPLGTLITVIVGVAQFSRQQKNMQIIEMQRIITGDSLKTEQRIVEDKNKVYFKISESVGIILAYDKKDSFFKQYIDDFEKIYYGEGLMVEDVSVNSAMLEFRQNVLDYWSGKDVSKYQVNEIGMALIDTLKQSMLKKKTVYKDY